MLYYIFIIKYYIYHIYISIITNVNIVNKLSNKPETFPPGTPFNSTEFLSRATVLMGAAGCFPAASPHMPTCCDCSGRVGCETKH